AVLLAAYWNAGGEIDLPAALDEMIRRGSMVPGGFCRLAGACGVSVSEECATRLQRRQIR
ncbi:MAG: DUF5714 domain-containing protein, partial [Methanocorpusculum sp.]|nr:DUF5714 domain-containing protein [Methanocorpusculum sp.]